MVNEGDYSCTPHICGFSKQRLNNNHVDAMPLLSPRMAQVTSILHANNFVVLGDLGLVTFVGQLELQADLNPIDDDQKIHYLLEQNEVMEQNNNQNVQPSTEVNGNCWSPTVQQTPVQNLGGNSGWKQQKTMVHLEGLQLHSLPSVSNRWKPYVG